MMYKTLLFFLFAFAIFPGGVHAADLSCTASNSQNGVLYTCPVVDNMEFPGNCNLAAQGTTNTVTCKGEPYGYSCTNNAGSYFCSPAPDVCTTGSSGGYDCSMIVSGKPPAGCAGSGAGMHCSALPSGYTLTTQSQVSPTSVTPSSVNNSGNSSSAGAQQTSGLTCSGGKCTYIPLEPGIIPAMQSNDFTGIITTIFRILFSLGGLFAVGMITLAGIQYMVSDVPQIKKVATERLWAAVMGLAILAGSYLILNTINPQLLQFKFSLNGGINGGPSVQNSNSTPNNNTNASQSYSSSSQTGKSFAASYGPLQNTPSSGALLVANRSDLSKPDVSSAYRNFYLGCIKAGGKPLMDSTADRNSVAYICKAK